ncbi:hypothetical protein JK636_07205 [Clostridium sp. YIM B02515]|uniref:Uncharacterized protein n=1 Tax=Clostridium rhizosphaerae TaxID=2803861 RepID=A0ABS1T8B5_9CLOT|nr:hypothetical protein [Clostridium rhizosphaerae]
MSVLPKIESGHGSSINNWTNRAMASLSMVCYKPFYFASYIAAWYFS